MEAHSAPFRPAKTSSRSCRTISRRRSPVSSSAPRCSCRPLLPLNALSSGGKARITICDDGPGIPKAVLRHLFERYWQAQETARKGHGLGLFISKGIIEAQGGTIWVESQLGSGTHVHFTLPLAAS